MKNKGYFNDDKPFKERVLSFFRESGFYVVIVLGLCAIAAGTVYFTTNNLISSPEKYDPDEIISENEGSITDQQVVELPVIPSKGNEQEKPESKENDSKTDTGLNEKIESDNSQETIAQASPKPLPTSAPQQETTEKVAPSPTTQPKNQSQDSEVINLFGKVQFVMPVQGEVITEYAMDKLIYSKTLDEWRTHSGIDIAAPRGEVVKAAADGIVTEIKNDPRYGITIVIDHQNGYKTIYSNLACDDMVSVNQKVKSGEAISSVGSTAIFECADPSHLHFEMYKDDKLVDPSKYLTVKE